MWDERDPWVAALSQLGIRPTGAAVDGLVFVRGGPGYTLRVSIAGWASPARVRVEVVPTRPGDPFLLLPREGCPVPPERRTGDLGFDELVVIATGSESVLPRLSSPLRGALVRLVGMLGATVSGHGCTLEPAWAARVDEVDVAVGVLRDLPVLATELCAPVDLAQGLSRWWTAEGAPGVERALADDVDARLGELTPEQSHTACTVLVDRVPGDPTERLVRMPLHRAVVETWLAHGNAVDGRLTQRVRESAASGCIEPAAIVLAWALDATGQDEARHGLVDALWQAPEVSMHPGVGDALVRELPPRPPEAARRLLEGVWPRDGDVALRLACQLGSFAHPEADARLLAWLAHSRGLAEIASRILAGRVVEELDRGRPRQVAAIAVAARTSAVLVDVLVRGVPRAHTAWLARLRPHQESPALALIRRLGEGGADVDEALVQWLDGGTRAVQLAAASALASAGSARVVPVLRERATGWFGDAVVRSHCRQAAHMVLSRVGGAGSLSLAQGESGALSLSDDE